MDSLRPAVGLARVLARVLALAPFSTALAATACTSALHTPPQIGDCIADGSVSCGVAPPTGGIELPVDGGGLEDSGEIISESLDGGSCGTIDTLVATDCSACMIQNCCMSDFLCSRDTNGCLLELECAAIGTPCPALTTASQTAYDDLLQCVDLYCPSQCVTVASHDI